MKGKSHRISKTIIVPRKYGIDSINLPAKASVTQLKDVGGTINIKKHKMPKARVQLGRVKQGPFRVKA